MLCISLKKIISTLAFASMSALPLAFAGIPVITAFNPSSGADGVTVAITGTDFDALPANNTVYFGAVRASVVSASPTQLLLTVPTGATYSPITVTVNGLTAYSGKSFLPTFLGDGTIDASSLAPRENLDAGSVPARVVFGDLDGDGKPDMAVANVYDGSVSVYRNISTNGTLAAASFEAPAVFSIGGGVDSLFGLTLADLDGDGRLDIVTANRQLNIVSIFQNVSSSGSLTTNSFAARVDIAVAGGPNSVAVGDLDGDGKPEIVSANIYASTVAVLQNIGVVGTITTGSFAPVVTLATGSGPSVVAIADMDGDSKPDLLTVNASVSSTVSVLRNISTAGSLSSSSFAAGVDLPGDNTGETLAVGDLDGDGKPDVVVGSYSGQTVAVYRNVSSPGTITTDSFAANVVFAAGASVHSVALGDLNGDGKPDVVLATESGSQLSVFQNQSVPGDFTTSSLASRVDFASGNNAVGIAIGDLDGDGRPDIAIGNAFDNTVSVYRNLIPVAVNCVTPPSGLVSWWRGESNALDVVGGNHGSLLNGASFNVGEVGEAFQFETTNGGIKVPASSSLDVGAGNGLTVEGWINPSDLSRRGEIVEWNNGNTNLVVAWGVHLSILGPGELGLGAGNLFADVHGTDGAVHWIMAPGGTITANTFQHVALTYDKITGLAKLYCNGVVVKQESLGSFTPLTSYDFYIGRRPAGDSVHSFLGIIDEVSVYNRALATSEIQSIYNASTAGKCHSTSAPVTTVQLSNPTVLAGTNVVLSAVVGGTGPFGYQWTFNGTNIAGATNDTLTLTNLHSWQSGNYYVTVTSPYGTNTSSAAVLTVVAENILIYKYSGTAKLTTLGSVLSYGYSGQLFFVPARTNGIFVGWAVIKGTKQYWTSSLSDYLLITIPGKGSQSFTVLGAAGQAIDENGQPHLWADLHKGQNTLLNIGNQQSYSFPNTLSSASTHAYPNPLTGRMVLSEASSTYTFAAQPTRTANNTGQTVTDLVGDLVKSLEAKGYRKQ